MSRQVIINYIENKIGISQQGFSEANWDCFLAERLKKLHIDDLATYWKVLQSSQEELQELIELLVVPESWFFRDKGAFDFLRAYLKNSWIGKRDLDGPFKVLSIPAASGEEPYSISMAILDVGLTKYEFCVDGIDISKKCNKNACGGVYHKCAFRGKDLEYRNRYFYKTPDGYAIKSSVKEPVHIYHGNVIDPMLNLKRHEYHFVFCRNLLIYLNENARKKVFEVLDKVLAKDGVIILSPSEMQIAHNEGWESVRYPRSCAFHRRSEFIDLGIEREKESIKPSKNQNLSPFPYDSSKEDIKKQPLTNSTSLAEKEKDRSLNKTELLHQAAALADNCYYEEATAACLNYLDQYGANAQVYYLLGVIYQAIERFDNAEEFLLKAVYLKPDFYEALSYLQLLCERRGDVNQASLFKRRAQKALEPILKGKDFYG